ncbi:MAG TPA: M1 family metallopeptidase [Dinghuibacter sp.]|uniref:M1 family metallopeptidase n=1 Tax=Dinghuibacter sp. TaxID=2024697 RepID=UPI002CBD4C2F|nr:M1 family metallopeptidase [Dinghuibacter sp.]HTJ12498.1 M1 family metallopeptidase [Dinghuibacter sp.]
MLIVLARAIPSMAQTALPAPWNVQTAIQKGTRTRTGDPGPNYWQNRADYQIKVSFDPATRLVSGSENVTYHNASPDTLRQLVLKLYPNLYKKGAIRMMEVSPEDLTDGVEVSNLTINGQESNRSRNRRGGGTDMNVGIPALKPGEDVHVSLHFAYTLNKGSHIRTGQVDSGSYFIAYFFPRIAVFDDIDGWNRIPYLGPQEFYNDFCNFSVGVTVPGNYVVWATGNLTNARDVLQPKIADRLADAERSDNITDIIDSADIGHVTASPDSNTWTFQADSVTDFCFALSNHYCWKASSLVVDPATGRRTRVDAAFNPWHKDFVEVIDFARKTVASMSYRFPHWPYPYPHETVFDGLDQMEYPMMVNDNPLSNRPETIFLTDHEIFHTMFPFYMGVNETKYAFMDEGWATIGEWVISPMVDSTVQDHDGIGAYSSRAGDEQDLPIITPSNNETDLAYYLNSYPKPGLGYYYARDMLGDSLFLKGVHDYIRTWHGKHPIPIDFFACMNRGTGRNLDWFWDRWFYQAGYPDLAIAAVRGHAVVVVSKGIKPVPIDLTVYFADGRTETIHRSIAVWEHATSVTVPVAGKGDIRKVTLRGPFDADRNTKDNEFIVQP